MHVRVNQEMFVLAMLLSYRKVWFEMCSCWRCPCDITSIWLHETHLGYICSHSASIDGVTWNVHPPNLLHFI